MSDQGYLGFNDPFLEVDNINLTTDKINALFDYEKIDRFVELGENDNAQSLNEIHKLLTNLLDQNNKILISNENWLQPTNVDKDTHKIFISNFPL